MRNARFTSTTGRMVVGRPSAKERGTAMVVVLALLVLLTVTLVAFFVRTTASMQTENTIVAGTKSEILARSAAETVIGDLRAEVLAGSVATTTNSHTIYEPVNSLRVRPVDTLQATIPAFSVAAADFANLIKQSLPGKPMFSAGAGLDVSKAEAVIQSSSSTRSDTPSKNRRAMSPSRWNAPLLLGTNGFAADQLPHWILLDREGVAANQSGTQNVLGRFAFNVYDVGGLLDANVAGFAPPSTGPVPQDASRKGGTTWADFRVLPGINPAAYNAAPTWLPKWRNTGDWKDFNQSTAASSYLFYHKTGWLEPYLVPGRSDRRFVNRQDLINYARANPSMFTSPDANRERLPALQFLTTFSRDRNSPVFSPHPNRPQIRTVATGGNDAVGKDDLINPALLGVRVESPFTRSDGSLAAVGQPLIASRFPLMRLKDVTRTASGPAADSSAIYSFFGLSRPASNHPWTYGHGVPNQILQLGQVATRGREPDFAELLKGAISAGSLGKASGQVILVVPPTAGNDDAFRNNWDRSLNYHVIQVMANTIDQFDEDGFPTRIRFDNRDFYGIENLPYLSAIRTAQAIVNPPPGPPSPHPLLSVFYQFQLWNPHNSLNLPPDTDRPTSFRIITSGSGELVMYQTPEFRVPYVLTNSELRFDTTSSQFSQPTYLRPGFGVPSPPSNLITGSDGRSYLGVFLANIACPSPASPFDYVTGLRVLTNNPGLRIELQYSGPTGWITYDSQRNFACDFGLASAPQQTFNTRFRSDPRTNRFGNLGGLNDGPGDQNKINSEIDSVIWPHDLTAAPETGNTIWPSLSFVSNGGGAGPDLVLNSPSIGLGRWSHIYFDTALGWRMGKVVGGLPDRGSWPGTLSRNLDNPDYLRYTDPDGVLRKADGAFANLATGDGLPLLTNNQASLPLVLNRPFQSVAELGYVFRDTPWKSLDFFTPESGDAALLDVFCIHESPPGGVVAGRVNLNTRQWPVLKALLSGSAILEDTSALLSDSQAEALAKALVGRTSSSNPALGPLLCRSDLVGRYTGSGFSGYSDDVGLALSGPDNAIKSRREAPARALAEAGSTRNWNFLIDIVAQSGRFPDNASNTDDFLVGGESRIWVHIAIDRWTGEILGKVYESVFE